MTLLSFKPHQAAAARGTSPCKAAAPGLEEQGAVIILAIFLIFVLLFFAGLAIDAGNLCHARLQLQKAADAGVIAGVGATILDRFNEQARIEQRAHQATLENLNLAGINRNVTITPNFDSALNTLTVRAEADIDFLLMDAVPFFVVGVGGIGDKARLAAVARGRRRETNVALLLDVSYSMGCPAVGPCTCQTPSRLPNVDCAAEAASLGVQQKITELRSAVTSFVSHFDPNRDRVILVPYNIAAHVAVPLSIDPVANKARRGFDQTEVAREIAALAPASNTNLCDAMLKAYEEFLRGGVTPDEEVAFVVFSDGAPTAGRFLYASPTAGAASFPATPGSLGLYPAGQRPFVNPAALRDYSHFAVEYSVPGAHYTGPSQLVNSTSLLFNHVIGSPLPAGAVPSCSAAYNPPMVPPASTVIFDPVFTGCLGGLDYRMPDPAGGAFGASYTAPYGYSWIEQYYNCAVTTSDFLRARRVMVYAIGLGDPNCIGGDPYQTASDTLSRKDILLARLANDYYEARTLAPPASLRCSGVGSSARHPDFGKGNLTYNQLAQQSPQRFGRYLWTTDAAQLRTLFNLIAAKIRLRLIE